MSTTRILKVLTTKLNAVPLMPLACFLIVALAITPLHAQFNFTDLYDFNCNTGGCYPADYGQLVQGADGNLYGTASIGVSLSGMGTVFMVTPSGSYNTLWQFDGVSGSVPYASLTLASDGNFYGTTELGGTSNCGTLFRITSGGSLTVLHNFTTAECPGPPDDPINAVPIQGKDGNLYGVTGAGTTYRVTLPAGKYKQLASNAPSGMYGPLVLASDGNLYGASLGGTSGAGTIFRMTTPGGAIQVIYNFSGTDGANPLSPLVQGAAGNLYGTTNSGGANGSGEIFQLTLTGELTILHSMDPDNPPGSGCNNDGEGVSAGLLAAADGYFYGVAGVGGEWCVGTIFQMSNTGDFNKLYDFDVLGAPVPGASPETTLLQHTNGTIYGLTSDFGVGQANGTFYSLTPINLKEILSVMGPIFLFPGGPVQILGNSLTHVIDISFGQASAQFQIDSDTLLSATVPSGAVDGVITATLDTGLQVQTDVAVHILPAITNLDPTSGSAGTQVGIVGGGFTGAKKVTFGGVKAKNFTVVTPSLIQAIVPVGAKTGKVTVAAPNGTATSKHIFTVD